MADKRFKLLAMTAMVLLLAGCGLFGKEKLQIDGERIDVLKEDSSLAPDFSASEVQVRLPEPYVNPKWTQSGGNSMHLMGHLSADSKLKQVWDESFGEGSSKRDFLIASPIMAYNVVFAIDAEGVVTARRMDNGDCIWERKLKPANRDDKGVAMKGAGIAEFDKKIYATTGFGGVFCLDMTTGKEIWRRDFETPFRIAPTVNAGTVFVQQIDNTLTALDANNGSELWRNVMDYENTTLLGGASPAYNPEMDVVIAAFSNGELQAFKASTGTPLWSDLLVSHKRSNSLDTITAIKANPVVDNAYVFAVGYNSVLTAIDLRSGQRVWERELGSSNQPWVAGDFIYVLTNNFDLLCLQKTTGKIVWNTSLPTGTSMSDKVGVFGNGPILASNRLIVTTSNGYIFAVSPYTGEILSYISTSDGIDLAPILAQGMTIFSTSDGDMLAYK